MIEIIVIKCSFRSYNICAYERLCVVNVNFPRIIQENFTEIINLNTALVENLWKTDADFEKEKNA